MTDVMSSDKRSALMSRIRGTNTKPELLVRKYLWHAGFRYRLHVAGLPGRPDLVLPKWNAVVFVHGCFWHRHTGCSYFRMPKTRTAFWKAKLTRNQDRDATAITMLKQDGWRVAVVWECALRADPDEVGRRLVRWMRRTMVDVQLEAKGSNIKSTRLEKPV